MKQIKIIKNRDAKNFEKEFNTFLQNEQIDIIDIKFNYVEYAMDNADETEREYFPQIPEHYFVALIIYSYYEP